MAEEKVYVIKDNKSKVESYSKTTIDAKIKDANDNFNNKIGAIDTLLDELNGEVI